jgi:hypothetical protein
MANKNGRPEATITHEVPIAQLRKWKRLAAVVDNVLAEISDRYSEDDSALVLDATYWRKSDDENEYDDGDGYLACCYARVLSEELRATVELAEERGSQ